MMDKKTRREKKQGFFTPNHPAERNRTLLPERVNALRAQVSGVFFIVCLLFLTSLCYAEQKYNPFENRWETVPDNSDWTPRYNPFEDNWSYQPDNAEVEYNPFEETWDWNSGQNLDNKHKEIGDGY